MAYWEKPVYKRLAASELGEAGHTSGIVPTVDTQPYFGFPKESESHIIKKIFVEFWIGNKSKIIVTNVHFFKSDTHNHIHLTGNLFPLYREAGAQIGDVLVFWKSREDENSFKAELIKQDSVRWSVITDSGFPNSGGYISLTPPGKITQPLDEDDESEDYEILSGIEETLTVVDFPTVDRRGRRKQGSRMITIRNKAKGDFVLKIQNYQCQVEVSHESFITPVGVAYMEKHHLISMRFYDEFEKDLDDVSNIVSLCPKCHRQIHLGRQEDVERIISVLYSKQKDALATSGFPITLKELNRRYRIN